MGLDGPHSNANEVLLWSPLRQSVCLLLQGNTFRAACWDFSSSIWFASDALIVQYLNVLPVVFVAERYFC